HDPYSPPRKLRPPVPAGVRSAIATGDIHELAMRINAHGAAPLDDVELGYLRALYDADIAAWDAELARLLDALAARGLRDSTILVILADHGEEFQDHGKLKHGIHLYEELIHVPLVIAGPGITPGRTATQVQGIDLFPTIATLLGASTPAGLPGQDILAEPAERPAFSETRYGVAPDGSSGRLRSIRTAAWKLIEATASGQAELFDLAHDPGERQDRFVDGADGSALARELAHFEATAPPPPAAVAADPNLHEKLRALGYVE
ncbi:MAG TPA: sulfatase-like hydrolase/transferase, partial [Candidatus Binatia bacterium]|nr:sulfatase-like hydrolase/transferase [Candidatus Binatia bacterium]